VIRVYALLVNWNGWKDTIECLESLYRSEEVDLRVIVCDNDSKDDSVERILAWADGHFDVYVPAANQLRCFTYPPLRKPISWAKYSNAEALSGGNKNVSPNLIMIKTGANLGFAGGNNVGICYALARGDFDYVWLLNNDTLVEPKSAAYLIKRMEDKPATGMCGSTLLYYKEPTRIQARGGGYYCKWIGLPWLLGQHQEYDDAFDHRRIEKWMNYVVGASLFVSKEFIENIGPLCEDYFLYFEECDWAIRSNGLYSLAYAPDSKVYHKIGESIGTSSDPRRKSLTCDYFAIRNRLMFTRRFYPYALPTIYLSILTAFVVRLMLGKWDHAAMILRLLVGLEKRS
jgi:GT2 family glycosyltransferase